MIPWGSDKSAGQRMTSHFPSAVGRPDMAQNCPSNGMPHNLFYEVFYKYIKNVYMYYTI